MHKRLILEYLKFWAKLQLKKNPKAIIIGVTGSAGKTSTRLALAQILKTHGVVKHSVHANSESGIPLNILNLTLSTYSLFDWFRVCLLAPIRALTLRDPYDYYVVEMGIDSPFPPKTMGYLLSLLRPHVAIILGASATHTKNFDPLVKDTSPQRRALKLIDLVAKEKMDLARAIPSSGTVVLNIDNAALRKYARFIKARLLSFGVSRSALLRLTKVDIGRKGFSMAFSYQGHVYSLSHPDVLGVEYAHTFVAALAAGSSLGIPISTGIAALQNYVAPAGRLRLFAGIKNTHLIDSTYNASPTTMQNALSLLSKLGGRAHKLAVLGDMRELGSSSKQCHRTLAQQIMQSADEAILYGRETEKYSLPILLSHHFPVHHFKTMPKLIAFLRSNLKPESWVLFKGSQNQIFLERALSPLLANPKDLSRLARRGPLWDKLRTQAP